MSDVAIVGGGPAGMTAALLLARAGRTVRLYDKADHLGGLWASRLDADGYFRGDNSCKVYQCDYTTAPALFGLLGTEWQEHFVERYDFTDHWLHPFVADCSWRDIAMFGAALVRHRLGRGRFHEVTVVEFMEQKGLTEACRAWLRATALGGIAGTLRMTMWEFFIRVDGNLGEIFRKSPAPLYWNRVPQNSPTGFVTLWDRAIREAGVDVRTGVGVEALDREADGLRLTLDDGRTDTAAAVLLAVPPPALGRLLEASPDAVAEGFGRSRAELRDYFAASVYEHLGITWFFDRELPTPLPLGGNNAQRGWHPILVEHQQYREQLRPPARSAVVGSVALDTGFRHHRLGTLASDYPHDELAALIWADEQERSPGLPDPIDFEIMGESSATQIVGRGPLSPAMDGAPVFLASNIHGRAPYFTASLESAIQAGALAAQACDPSVERLPMGPPRDLPWGRD